MKKRFSEESRSDHIALLRAFEVHYTDVMYCVIHVYRVGLYTCKYIHTVM